MDNLEHEFEASKELRMVAENAFRYSTVLDKLHLS